MPDILEHRRNLRNGRDGQQIAAGSTMALGNTNPLATRGSTFGADAPAPVKTLASIVREWGYAPHEHVPEQTFVLQGAGALGVVFSVLESKVVVYRIESTQKGASKPAGQVVLFKKVMDQWAFSEKEAATLLGFEHVADIRDIYEGRKTIGHRDANDRLRAVLRIAADIDALFKDADAIRDWLNEPQKDLGGKAPRALLNEGSMENLLQVKYYVAHLSGR